MFKGFFYDSILRVSKILLESFEKLRCYKYTAKPNNLILGLLIGKHLVTKYTPSNLCTLNKSLILLFQVDFLLACHKNNPS